MIYKLKIIILLLAIQTACQSQTKKKMNVEDKTYSSPLAKQLAFKEDMLIPYKVGDKFGYCDQDLNIVIKPQWTFAYPFVNGYARVMDPLTPAEGSTEIMAMINRKGEIVSKKPYQWIGEMMDHGHCIVQLPGQWDGVMDHEGKEVIPSQYKYIDYFEDMEMYAVSHNNKYGLFDQDGKQLLPFEFDEITKLSGQDVFGVIKEGKHGYLDKKLAWIVPPKYDYNESLKLETGLFYTNDLGKKRVLNLKGEVLFDATKYKSAKIATANSIRVGKKVEGIKDTQFTLFDIKSGEQLQPFKFTYIEYFQYGYAPAKIINKEGQEKTGLINEKGEFVIDPIYEYVTINGDNLVFVEKDKENKMLVDFQGKILYKTKHDVFPFLQSDNKQVYREIDSASNYGLIDKNGNTLLPMIYQNIRDIGFEQGLMMVEKDGEKYYVDLRGREYRAPE